MSKKGIQVVSVTRSLYSKSLYLVIFINFSLVSAASPIMVSFRHLDIRFGKHIGASPLNGKKDKPSNESAFCALLLHCNFLPSFDNFSILAHENKKYLLEVKESLLIMRKKPSLNRNINSASLHFIKSSLFLVYFTLVYLT